MEYRKLGRTDLEVSVICLGTMNMGEQNDEQEGHEQLDYSLDQGVNFIDTAELYSVPPKPETQGSTERIIGTWIKKRGRRDDFILATKIAGPAEFTKHIRTDSDFTPATLDAAIEGSLHRLQTDYIDLYQLHWPSRKTNFFGKRGYSRHDGQWEDYCLEILRALQKHVDAGHIRYVGLSNETPWGLSHYLHLADKHELPRMVSVQNPYSLLNRLYEVGLAEMSIREDAGLLAYSPMAFGLLSGKYHKGTDKPTDRINKYERMSRYNGANCHSATAKYLTIAEKYDLSLAQMSLAFVNQQPFLTSNIIGATTMSQLAENISSIDIELSRECLNEIEAVHEEIPNPAP
ncbi:MAG: NADP(H)-dependent aldo-keto reductase [Bacteroidota bacterium]